MHTLFAALLGSCAAAVLHIQPPAAHAAVWLVPSLGHSPKAMTASRHPPVVLMGKKKAPAEDPRSPQEILAELQGLEDAANDEDYATADDDDDNPFSSRVRLVDPMKFSLGREKELEPFPGPPIVEDQTKVTDSRLLFASMRFFTPGRMPSPTLQAFYLSWLGKESGDRICLPHYLLAAQDFSVEMDTKGERLTDDELALLNAKEEEAKATVASEEAAAAAESGDVQTADEASANEAAVATAVAEPVGVAATPSEQAVMQPMEVQFVLGHFTVGRWPSWAHAESWTSSDPIALQSGYGGGTHLHQWLPLEEAELMVAPAGEIQQSFVVHCVDKPGSMEVRGQTREAHLTWLRESGRVQRAGPLLAPPEGAEAAKNELSTGERVGSLLIVSGDNLEQVRDWAAADPYVSAGLFERVTIAPLASYYLEEELDL